MTLSREEARKSSSAVTRKASRIRMHLKRNAIVVAVKGEEEALGQPTILVLERALAHGLFGGVEEGKLCTLSDHSDMQHLRDSSIRLRDQFCKGPIIAQS